MCLKSQRGRLSTACNVAIAQTEAAFRELKSRGEEPMPPGQGPPFHHHPHAAGFVLFMIFLSALLCLCSGCARKLRKKPEGAKGDMKAVLVALADPANAELKAALEDAAGVGLPSGPGWKRRVRAALEANPELKVAVDAAVAQAVRLMADDDEDEEAASGARKTLRAGDGALAVATAVTKSNAAAAATTEAPKPHPGAVCARRVMKCWAVVVGFILMAFFFGLLGSCGGRRHGGGPPPQDEQGGAAEEGPSTEDESYEDGQGPDGGPPPPPRHASPLEGFVFAIGCGFLIMGVCGVLHHLCTKCGKPRSQESAVEEDSVAEEDVEAATVDDISAAKAAAKAKYAATATTQPPANSAVILVRSAPVAYQVLSAPPPPSLDEIRQSAL